MGNVYVLIDYNSDGVVDRKMVIVIGFEMFLGLVVKDGDLYVVEVLCIICFKDIDKNLKDFKFEVVYDKFLIDCYYGWKFISFVLIGELIVFVGVLCNICVEDDKYGCIFLLDVDIKEIKIIVKGVCNLVGFDYYLIINVFWFSDNGCDMMGDDMFFCEINCVGEGEEGVYYGFFYVYVGVILDFEFG